MTGGERVGVRGRWRPLAVAVEVNGAHGEECDEDEERECNEEPHGSNSVTALKLPPVAEMTLSVDLLPTLVNAERVKKIAVVVDQGVEPFGLGALCELWAEPYHPDDDNPVFEFVICTPEPGMVRSSAGFDLHVTDGLEALEGADLVCVAPKRDYSRSNPAINAALVQVDARGGRIFAHCTAAFTLGAAGLLAGKRCTTHWRYADELARMYPEATVEPDVLYVQEGNLTTGAGAAAALDAGLHLMREIFGAATAATAARRMVVAPHRSGGQSQFITRAVPHCDVQTLGPLLEWIVGNLRGDLSVEALAKRANMSPRTFARRFRAETGHTPYAWIIEHRVAAAEELLESADMSIERVAHEVGFATAATLRQHFSARRGVSPQGYQRTFAGV